MRAGDRPTFLVFRCGPYYFAASIDVIQRIVPLDEVKIDPRQGYVWREQAYASLDSLFPHETHGPALVLFTTQNGTGGLRVDEVVGLEEIPSVHHYPIPEVWFESRRPWVHATYFPDPHRPPVFLLRVERLLQDRTSGKPAESEPDPGAEST